MMKKRYLRREVVGFSLVGSLSFVVDFVSFNGFALLGLDLWISNILALSCSVLLGFLGYFFYSLRHRFEQGSQSALAGRYAFFSVVSTFVSAGLTAVSLAQLSNQSLLLINRARVAVILGVVVLRFLGLKFIVYKSQTRNEVPSA